MKVDLKRTSGAMAEALLAAEEGLRFIEGKSDSMTPWLQYQLASLMVGIGDFERVLPLLQEASEGVDVKRHAKMQHESLRSMILGERGNFFLKIGNTDHAAFWLDQEMEAAMECDHFDALRCSKLNRTRLAMARWSYEECLKLAREGRRDHQKRGIVDSVSAQFRLLEGLSGYHLKQVSIEEVVSILEDPLLGPLSILAPLLRFAWVRTGDGDLDGARTILEKAREVLAGISSGSTSRDANHRRALHDAVTSRLERALCRREEKPDSKRLRDCLLASKMSFDSFLQVWETVPLIEGGVGFLQYKDQTRIVGELLTLTLEVYPGNDGVGRAFQELVRAQALGTLARKLGVKVGDEGLLSRIRSRVIKPNGGLIVFLPGPDQGHVFLVDQETIRHEFLPDRDSLLLARDELVSQILERPGFEDGRVDPFSTMLVEKSARKLTELLLPERVQEHIRGLSSIAVVGDDQLGWIPMSCLLLASPDEKVAPRPLGLTHAISYLPSVPVGLHLARMVREKKIVKNIDLNLIYFGDKAIKNHPSWSKIPFSSSSLNKIYASPRKIKISQSLDPATLKDVQVLQFLTHGDSDPGLPRPAKLLMSGSNDFSDGIFDCRDAEKWTSPPLVVLTACGSGRGQVRRGEAGVSSFEGAFLSMGAKAVLSSPGDLDVMSTLALTEFFHQALVQKHSPAEALRQARVRVANTPRFDHPYFYALMRVVGVGHRPIF